ncbi:hypothetical protein IQ07DRAFT_639504 [Pyrenochaeta sp. DS3sAY3a]|nr:hypothetical protein IQ07DRAFT_639504 [Pyrenochaeta sp. DS3sAY3a]
MTTPVGERPEPTYHMDSTIPATRQRSSDDDGTFVGDSLSRQHSDTQDGPGIRSEYRPRSGTHLTVDTAHDIAAMRSIQSPSQTREQASRLNDDLAVLQIEQGIEHDSLQRNQSSNRSMTRVRSRREDLVDEFDAATNPLHEQAARYNPPENPTTSFSKFFKKVHNSSWVVRYFTYITPMVLVILIPLLLGALAFPRANVGGVKLVWFSIWLMIVWLTLWAGRLLAKMLPWPIGLVASLFTNNSKKWRDMGKQLELPATLFFWWLAIEVSFLPTMTNHHIEGRKDTLPWQKTMNKVLVTFFVGFVLNFVEKIILQLIAISFHLRTYQDRIELNKFQIGSLAKLYKYSKEKIAMEDSEFEQSDKAGGPSGARTPGQLVTEAQKNIKVGFNKFGDIAGKVAGDFTGRQVTSSGHPNQVVLGLIATTSGAQVLARRLYRTFARPETETVYSEDLRNAFESDEEADAAFSMFDKDMNGDISMEELEAVCVEIGRERKSITASLKDLDSVVSKLDDVFMFIVLIITIIVFISLISTSAAGVLTSAGSTLLALSWLFSATAQEFLQSVIFVFVKHPYDVGDRVMVYGNSGDLGRGDDYFVKEIALFYTEFKKMQGHIVQAPNSYLNSLFILNHRRSGALAEAVPIIIKFGTTLEQIENLRETLLAFVTAEKREYQTNILTELRAVQEVHWLELNVVFFYKSNWQNELLRLQRRNKFICALTMAIQECGIEGPRMRYPGQKESFPVYLQNLQNPATPGMGVNGSPDNPSGNLANHQPLDEPFVAPMEGTTDGTRDGSVPGRRASILRQPGGRPRGESLAAMGRRVDFSLGMKSMGLNDPSGDVLDDRENETRARQTIVRVTSPSRSQDRTRESHDSARSTSIQRVNTNASSVARERTHRNRFFSRNRHVDEEAGMDDIPEAETPPAKQKLDPRSGLISPQAVRISNDESRMPQSSGALPNTADSERTFVHPSRAQTDNIEMRRFH